MIFEDLEVFVWRGQLAEAPELHHLEGAVHQPRGEALQARAVVAVGGQQPPLPPNSRHQRIYAGRVVSYRFNCLISTH